MPEVFFGLEQVQPDSSCVLTVGSFDGLHVGHRAILAETKREAEKRGVRSAAVTFEPHPQLVLKKSGRPPLQILSTLEEKIELLRACGVDGIVVVPFTREFAQTPSEVFVREILHRRLGMQAIVIGHDHGFGKNREGDVATLQALGRQLGFAVHEVPPLKMGGRVISSTLIREALLRAQLRRANAWLGYCYRLSGTVVRGAQRGRQIGFPTLNLEPLHAHKLVPANGVYAVRAKMKEGEYGGMMNIGMRPTFSGGSRSLEAHLFDFARTAYGEICEIEFVARLRGERKFEAIDDLKKQLQRDRAASREVLVKNAVR